MQRDVSTPCMNGSAFENQAKCPMLYTEIPYFRINKLPLRCWSKVCAYFVGRTTRSSGSSAERRRRALSHDDLDHSQPQLLFIRPRCRSMVLRLAGEKCVLQWLHKAVLTTCSHHEPDQLKHGIRRPSFHSALCNEYYSPSHTRCLANASC